MGEYCLFMIPPTLHPQITGQEYSYKILYILGQKGWLYLGENRKT